MVDVSEKQITARLAIAMGVVVLDREIVDQFNRKEETPEINSPKGPIIKTAIIAGTMAVKNTAQVIPFCHPLLITGVEFDVKLLGSDLKIKCQVKTNSPTGVEMEALNGVSVACLTVYDMCKSISSNMVIKNLQLLKKTGGKSDLDKSSNLEKLSQ